MLTRLTIGKLLATAFLLQIVVGVQAAIAGTYVLPPGDTDLVGQIRMANARQEDTLLDIARRFDVGQDEILLANRRVDRWLPGEGAEVVIPTRFILPDAKRSGIVLNVPEMRLYYFPPPKEDEAPVVITHPVSIGRMDWTTPLGTTRVVAKVKDPSWRPPASIRAEAEADGEPLPELIPAGPDNPLGRYAMRLGIPGYLIHSTNKPYGVGMRVTHGCVRMYPEDIETLFPQVPTGMEVQIVDQPVKLGWLADTLFVEVHSPLEEKGHGTEQLMDLAVDLVYKVAASRGFSVSGGALRKAVEERRGIPVSISRGARVSDTKNPR